MEAADHILLPREIHPAFFGCFDWHSSVHGHWMLIKLLKEFPQMKNAASIRAVLDATLTRENLLKEAEYFSRPLTASWERTYGWAWLLKLYAELTLWADPDGIGWHQNLKPMVSKVIASWKTFLPNKPTQIAPAFIPIQHSDLHLLMITR